MGERAEWSNDGAPLNLEAAIADAVLWLDYLARLPPVRRDIDESAKLRAAIYALAAYGDNVMRERFGAPPEPEESDG